MFVVQTDKRVEELLSKKDIKIPGHAVEVFLFIFFFTYLASLSLFIKPSSSRLCCHDNCMGNDFSSVVQQLKVDRDRTSLIYRLIDWLIEVCRNGGVYYSCLTQQLTHWWIGLSELMTTYVRLLSFYLIYYSRLSITRYRLCHFFGNNFCHRVHSQTRQCYILYLRQSAVCNLSLKNIEPIHGVLFSYLNGAFRFVATSCAGTWQKVKWWKCTMSTPFLTLLCALLQTNRRFMQHHITMSNCDI